VSTLIVRMPSHAAAEEADDWTRLRCAYVMSDGDLADGVETLADLAGEIADARRLVLVIAASDVTVMRVKVPPLSASQLRRALPNLVEDRLLSDPAECVFVATPVEDGMCTVAIMQRGWLETVARTLAGYGASAVVAVPAQLCLPPEADGAVAAAVTVDQREITLRLSPDAGYGVHLAAEGAGAVAHGGEAVAAAQVLQALAAMLPASRIRLRAPAQRLHAYRQALQHMQAEQGPELALPTVEFEADDWARWVRSIGAVEMNLLADAPNAASARHRDWRSRRLLAGLAAAVLVVNVAGLNAQWWRLAHEARQLQDGMLQTYRSTFPQDTVIVDPLLQMQRHLADMQRGGNLAPDGFLSLLARFGAAWSKGTGTPPAPQIVHLAYAGGTLNIGLQPDGDTTMNTLADALRAQKLTATAAGQGQWQVRNAP